VALAAAHHRAAQDRHLASRRTLASYPPFWFTNKFAAYDVKKDREKSPRQKVIGKSPTIDAIGGRPDTICEAVRRRTMRFVETKTPERQSCLLLHRTRHLLVRQLNAVSNALRAHLAEFGICCTGWTSWGRGAAAAFDRVRPGGEGMDTRRLQHFLGHAIITNTVRYTAMSPEPLRMSGARARRNRLAFAADALNDAPRG
jgi:hypothetical protein